jgi:rod shape-determining protein MreC
VKSSFLWRNRIALTSGALLIIALHLVSVGVRPSDREAFPQALLLEALRPIQLGSARLADGAIQIFRGYIDLVGTQRENARLKAQLDRLNSERAHAEELEAENQRLGGLLDLRQALGLDAVAAEVIGSDATGAARTLVIARGSAGGIKPGMAVVSSEGVVGKIIETSPHAARVLLIDDHNSALDAFDQRTRARGIIAGVPDDGLTMKYVDRADELKVGDPVVTSGLDGIFPRGMLVGYVTAVRREGPGLFLSVDVGPAVSFRRLEEVLVVTAQLPKLAEPAKG